MESLHHIEQNEMQTNQKLVDSLSKLEMIKLRLQEVIIGQHELIDFLLLGILSGGNCLIEGVPGIAKTVTAKLIAKSLELDFSRIQFTPDLMPSDILGTSIFNQKTSEFEYRKGPIFSNLILIDEINRAPAKTQAALFEVMAEKQITIDGNSYHMEHPFIVFATQNPIEQEGTYKLPEAQLDRFLFNIQVDYPNLESEIAILDGYHSRQSTKIEESSLPSISKEQILVLQEAVFKISIKNELVKYIAEIVHATRNNNFLYLGASPRASIAILQSAKANALLNGRDFVIPEDIKKVAVPALIHRIVLSPEKEMEGITNQFAIHQIIENVQVPR